MTVTKKIFTVLLILVLAVAAISCGRSADPAGQEELGGPIPAQSAAEPNTADHGQLSPAEDQQNVTAQGRQPVESASAAESEVGIGKTAENEPVMPPEGKRTVNITIRSKAGGPILPGTPIEWKQGDTALSVLIRAGKQYGIPVVYRGSQTAAYVEGINNLFEFDQGPESGWIYGVNGVRAGVGCGTCQVSAGEALEWVYVTSLGEGLQ